MAVAAIVVFLISSIQTLGRISWLGWVGVCSILASVVTLAIAVGVESRPAAAPTTGTYDKDVQAVKAVSFVDAMNAINIVLFAYAGSESSTPTPLSFSSVSVLTASAQLYADRQ